MKITIIIDGVERNYQGSYDELYNRDWNERVREFLDDVNEYEDVPEIPGFEGTRAQLDALTIRK